MESHRRFSRITHVDARNQYTTFAFLFSITGHFSHRCTRYSVYCTATVHGTGVANTAVGIHSPSSRGGAGALTRGEVRSCIPRSVWQPVVALFRSGVQIGELARPRLRRHLLPAGRHRLVRISRWVVEYGEHIVFVHEKRDGSRESHRKQEYLGQITGRISAGSVPEAVACIGVIDAVRYDGGPATPVSQLRT